ncbi:Hercynylcysteine sulfoxide lyase [Psilocybe cubensis]|uniref:Hercynylcysteine sulfoxide lyase n=2 Tax=Psilocybe cubensis TaxID=181762 RepID=A0ACB8GKP3_PSICU|nr:Hercynylcysteine sulfoxide lyase [Psilocybe cubensis]KAH9475962.1 Hercynylcysteine sulfoxide lyase [Psilocybe cubensis]
MKEKTPLEVSQDFEVRRYGRDCRELFFTDSNFINLNHASFGTIPEPVLRACEALSRECERNPDLFIRGQLFDRSTRAREVVCQLLGADADTCVFVSNVATAMSNVLCSISLTERDHIIYTDAVFESVSTAILNIPSRPQTSVFKLAEGALSHQSILARFRDHIREVQKQMDDKEANTVSLSIQPRKTVVVIESITASPGLLLPWREMVRICREENALSIVDAAHSLGQELNLNLKEVDPDFWMTNCSKWYYAHRGCAVLYVPIRNQGMIKTQLVPGTRYPTRGSTPPDFVHEFYWSGMIDPIPFLSVEIARSFRDKLGGEKAINDYCRSLAVTGGRLVSEKLGTSVMDQTEGNELTANITNIELPLPPNITPSKEIFFLYQDEMLDNHRVFAPAFYYMGKWWVRASAQIYNDLSDFEQLAHALAETCEKLIDCVVLRKK